MLKKLPKQSPKKREKLNPSKSAEGDESLDCKEIIQKLEAENRLLTINLEDLEFSLEEETVKKEFLKKQESQNGNKNDENDETNQKSHFNVDELKQTVYDLTKQKKDLESRVNYSKYRYEEKKADFEFMQLEISELKSINSSVDEQQLLEKQLSEMEEELRTNGERLTILLNEEKNANDSIKAREDSIKNSKSLYNGKHSVQNNWEEERSEVQQRRKQVKHKIAKLEEKEKETNDHLTALKSQFYFELGVDEKELKKAIFAEIEFNTNQTFMNLQNAIATEIEYNNILENELNEVRNATNYIKKYREICFQRGRNQYELESSRKRLELLQEKLDQISSSLSSSPQPVFV